MPTSPTLQKALEGYWIWQTGDTVLRAYLDLELGDPTGGWHLVEFRLDSGTDMTPVPASFAQSMGLPLGTGPYLITQMTADGQQQPQCVYSGLLKARVPGLDQTVYYFLCYFVGDPNAPVPPAAARLQNLLGLTGVVDQLQIILDGTPIPGGQFGSFIIEKK
jgi:hypothetical protein